jgi:hypothetical protein
MKHASTTTCLYTVHEIRERKEEEVRLEVAYQCSPCVFILKYKGSSLLSKHKSIHLNENIVDRI